MQPKNIVAVLLLVIPALLKAENHHEHFHSLWRFEDLQSIIHSGLGHSTGENLLRLQVANALTASPTEFGRIDAIKKIVGYRGFDHLLHVNGYLDADHSSLDVLLDPSKKRALEEFLSIYFQEGGKAKLEQQMETMAAQLKAVPRSMGDVLFAKIAGSSAISTVEALYGKDKIDHLISAWKLNPEMLPRNKDGEYAPSVRKKFQKHFEKKTFDEACSEIHSVFAQKDPEMKSGTVQRSFFEFTHLNPNGAATYHAMETVRSNAMAVLRDHLPPQHFAALITQLIEDSDWRATSPDGPLSLSVPAKDFNRTMFIYAAALRTPAPLFLMGYPRRFLIGDSDEVFEEKIQKWLGGVKEGWAKGLDLTGSMGESEFAEVSPELERRLQQRLSRIFELSRKNESLLQVHMFEEANKGSFYRAFQKALKEEAPKPGNSLLLAVAHINAITPPDVVFFRDCFTNSSGKIVPIFHMNLASNEILHGTKAENMVPVIGVLQSLGFSVMLGADGQGILGDRSRAVSSIVRLENAGLPKKNAVQLLADSLLDNRPGYCRRMYKRLKQRNLQTDLVN